MAITKKIQHKIDYTLLTIALALLAYGLIVLYSASTVESFQNFGNTSHYILHQLIFGALIGLVAMFVLSKINYHVWQKFMPQLIFISLILLALVKVPGIGVSAGGAERWVHFGPILFQPAELAKMVIILYLASWIDKKRHKLNDFYYGVLPSLIIISLFALLILFQPDVGTMLVLLVVAFFMLIAGGIDLKYIAYCIFGGAGLLYLIVKLEPYRVRRLTTFFNTAIDPKGISYQINQALLAIGSGGFWGFGYGMSRQKHNYLPEVMNDSIFAVMSEELGFFRVLISLLLFAALAWKGFSIAKNAPDTFGKLVAFGITCWITVQTLINLAAMVNLLPLTGIPLPFFSYGSTALIANLGAIGILLNISSYSQKARAR